MMPEDRQLLYQLIEQRTRAEIMSRLCPFFAWPEWGQLYFDLQKIDDDIRDLLYGTHDLVELGHRWDMPINPPTEKEKERRARREAEKQRELKMKGKPDERRERRGPREGGRKPLL